MSASRTIALLNGPNLNLLGQRNTAVYGATTFRTVERALENHAIQHGLRLWSHQSNSEGGLIGAVHVARWSCCAIIINPGGYTHTSIALRDALEAFAGPIAEVHLSDIYAREEFRHRSYVKDVAFLSVVGKGPEGYTEAFDAIVGRLQAPAAA